MNILNKVIAWTAISSVVVVSAFAADIKAPTNIKQTSSTDDSITFSWDAVNWAFGYYIYWGEDSASKFGEFVSEPNYTLTGLEKGKAYKISVTAVNEEDAESEKAPEVTMTTGTSVAPANAPQSAKNSAPKISANADFGLARIEILSPTEMNLIFTKNLEEGQDIASQIKFEDDKGEEIVLKNVDFGLTPNTVVAALPDNLKTDADYKITILALKDFAGNVIENGIDAVTNFTTPSEFKIGEVVVIDTKENTVEVKTTEELQKEKEQEKVSKPENKENKDKKETEEKIPDLNAAGLEKKTKEGLSKEKKEDTKTSETAKKADALPEAGAEHIFLLMIALLTAGGFAFYSTKKNK